MSDSLSILLVDDHEDTSRSFMLLLRRRGYQIQTAPDVARAEELARGEVFDVLISDMNLPDGSGIDLLQRLENPPKYGGILISGYGQDEDVERSRAAGYKAHLVKPIEVQRLDDTIRRVVREAGQTV